MREKKLTEQLIIRITPELRVALKKNAEENERTESQSARYYLKLCLIGDDEVVNED